MIVNAEQARKDVHRPTDNCHIGKAVLGMVVNERSNASPPLCRACGRQLTDCYTRKQNANGSPQGVVRMTNRRTGLCEGELAAWGVSERFILPDGSRVMPVDGTDLVSRRTQYVENAARSGW